MKLILATLAAAASAQWNPSPNVTASWPGNDERPAGAIVQFDSPANSIVNGTGSCSITVNTLTVSFMHFFNAHVFGVYDGSGTWNIAAPSSWEDQGSYSFLVNADAEPANANFDITCQDSAGVPAGTPLLNSFPQDPSAVDARGSFTFQRNGDGSTTVPDSVSLSFDVGNGPTNVTVDDVRLSVSNVGDAWIVSGMDGVVNYDDVWFSIEYGAATVPAYEITIS